MNASDSVSPFTFAMWQLAGRIAPPILVIAFILGAGYAIAGIGQPSWTDTLSRLGAGLFYVLTTGGLALAYLCALLSLQAQGMVSSPAVPWTVEVRDDCLKLATSSLTTLLPLKRVVRATEVVDDNWDKFKGQEDECLILNLGAGTTVIVPASSRGYNEVRTAVAAHMEIRIKYVE